MCILRYRTVKWPTPWRCSSSVSCLPPIRTIGFPAANSCGSAELGSGNDESFGRALVEHGAVQVPNRSRGDRALIPLDLDDQLAAADRIGIHGQDIDAPVAGAPGRHDLHSHRLEELSDKILKIDGIHAKQADLGGRLAPPGAGRKRQPELGARASAFPAEVRAGPAGRLPGS